MGGTKLLCLLLVFTVCDCKLKCKPVICPPCDFQFFDTVEENQLRVLTAKGPADGSCENSVKVINRGSVYGFDYDACCCMPLADYSPIQCNPMGPGISMCPTGPPFNKSEALGKYAIRAGELIKDLAPEDGCCPDGLSKFHCPPFLVGQPKQLCLCFDPNSYAAETTPSSSNSTMSTPDIGSTSSDYVDNTTPSSDSNSTFFCPPCNLQPFDTIEENQLRILTAKGPADGICEQGVKVINHGSDYGLEYDACCCMPPTDYPPIQCDPMGPGISMCPTGPSFFKNELFGEYAIRAGELVKDSAPEDGCCPDGLSKLLCPPLFSGQSKQLCLCFDPNPHPAETATVCPSCDFQLDETPKGNELRILNARGPADGICEGSDVKIIYHRKDYDYNVDFDYGLGNDACCCIPVPEYPPLQCDPLGPGISMCPSTPKFIPGETFGHYVDRVGVRKVQNTAPADGCCANGTTKYIFPPTVLGQSYQLCVCFDPNNPFELIENYDDY